MMNQRRNTGKTVLITGTTSGIGYSFSKIFAQKGFNLVLVSRNKQKLEQQKEELMKKYDVRVYSIAEELSEPRVGEKVRENVVRLGLHIDILINNAGFNECGQFKETNLEKELQMLQLHMGTLTHLTKIFLPAMIQNKFGKILNLGSIGSFAPCPHDAVYAASKSYVLSFTNAIRAELAGTGVTVSTLCPGATKTEFAKKTKMENTRLFTNFVMEADSVAEIAYKGMMKGEKVIIPGLINRLLVASLPMTPSSVLDKLSMMLVGRRN